jgi:hypothetical protein
VNGKSPVAPWRATGDFFILMSRSMKMRRLWIGGISLALACLMAGAACAQQEREPSLERYVGKSPDKQFLGLLEVRDPLKKLMGERLEEFLSRFQQVTPIDQVSRDIVAQGCVRSSCAAEQAAFAINLDTGGASAASLTQGRYMDIYSDTTKYNDLPPGLRRWISSRTSQSTHFKRIKLRFFK